MPIKRKPAPDTIKYMHESDTRYNELCLTIQKIELALFGDEQAGICGAVDKINEMHSTFISGNGFVKVSIKIIAALGIIMGLVYSCWKMLHGN